MALFIFFSFFSFLTLPELQFKTHFSLFCGWSRRHAISNLSKARWLLAEAQALYADVWLHTYMQCQFLHTRLALFYYKRQQICMPSTGNFCANASMYATHTHRHTWRHTDTQTHTRNIFLSALWRRESGVFNLFFFFFISVIMCKCRSQTVYSAQAWRDALPWQTCETESVGWSCRR